MNEMQLKVIEEEMVLCTNKPVEFASGSGMVSTPDKLIFIASMNKFDILGVDDVEKEVTMVNCRSLGGSENKYEGDVAIGKGYGNFEEGGGKI